MTFKFPKKFPKAWVKAFERGPIQLTKGEFRIVGKKRRITAKKPLILRNGGNPIKESPLGGSAFGVVPPVGKDLKITVDWEDGTSDIYNKGQPLPSDLSTAIRVHLENSVCKYSHNAPWLGTNIVCLNKLENETVELFLASVLELEYPDEYQMLDFDAQSWLFQSLEWVDNGVKATFTTSGFPVPLVAFTLREADEKVFIGFQLNEVTYTRPGTETALRFQVKFSRTIRFMEPNPVEGESDIPHEEEATGTWSYKARGRFKFDSMSGFFTFREPRTWIKCAAKKVWVISGFGRGFGSYSINLHLSLETNPPSSCDAGWTNCSNAHTDDSNYAEGTTNGQQGVWDGFGFSLSTSDVIDSVKIKVKTYVGDATKHSISLEVYDGHSWGTVHPATPSETPCTEQIIDVSGDFTWNFANVNKLKVRLTANIGAGAPANKWARCCYIEAQVEYHNDPNFGYETVGSRSVTIVNSIYGSWFTCPESGTADSITAYIEIFQSTDKVKCALYKKSDNSLVGSTEEKTGLSTGAQWITFNFGAPKPSLENIDYYIVAWGYIQSDWDVDPRLHYDSEPNKGCSDFETYNTFPDPLEPGSTDLIHSIYCTYTAAPPPPPPPPVEENPLISKPLASPIKVGKPLIR